MNQEISKILYEMSLFLAMDDVPFKPRAFEKAALSVGALDTDVGELYASGEQALRNGQPQRAVGLLQRAIQKRPQPGLAVPTYGTNFEPRYFPYFRLAEAYLRVEAYDEALNALGDVGAVRGGTGR